MVHRSRRALTTIVAGVLILITLITNVILFVFIQQDAKNRVRGNIEAKTLTALYALEPNIPPKEFSELVATKQTSLPAYEALRSYMALVKQRAGFKYLYTLAKDPSGTLIYVIDGGDPKSEGFSKLGDKATTDEFKGYREVMASGKPRVDVSKSKEWGHIMTVYYPLKNANGTVIGVIGADHEMQSVYDAIAKRTRFFAWLIALITLLGLTATVLAAIIIRRTERNRLKTHENLE